MSEKIMSGSERNGPMHKRDRRPFGAMTVQPDPVRVSANHPNAVEVLDHPFGGGLYDRKAAPST